MLVGYARLCPYDHATAAQVDALQSAGCDATFMDITRRDQCEYIGLAAAVAFVRDGDTLVVWRLDRLGRSLPHLIELMEALQARQVGFRSLAEGIDTTSSGATPVACLIAALAAVERNLRRERTLVALEAARADGRRGGRPRLLTTEQATLAQALYDDLANSIDDICRTLRISQKTLYRYVHAGTRKLWTQREPGSRRAVVQG